MKPFKYVVFFCSALVLVACSSHRPFSKGDVKNAQKLYGLDIGDKPTDVAYDYLLRNYHAYDTMRRYTLGNDVFPALLFDPLPSHWKGPPQNESCQYIPEDPEEKTPSAFDLPYASLRELSFWMRTGKVSSVQLTRMYLERIKKYDGQLHSVITLLEERALTQARKRDQELAQGIYRGPLHGIPYGVKDLFSLDGYRTTWGSEPYRDQELEGTATVITRLDSAGAVLLAKLTSGALARGDVWFGGQTKNPWDTLQGAGGSSAGSGSATAAGLVGFSIGTETLGSITSPSNRNGVSGLRPTYGRVSRTGVMSLSWSMDKVGPICRFAEDCALVFQAIYGSDGKDPAIIEEAFCFDPSRPFNELRVAVLANDLNKDTTAAKANILSALQVLKDMGLKIMNDSMPENAPFAVFDIILRVEAGAFFDDLVRSGRVDKMVQQGSRSRANSLRQSRFIPAVEYIQAQRHRRVLIESVDSLFKKYDIIIAPTFGRQLLITNLTGHPVVTVPCGTDEKGRPTSISFLGNLFDEAAILRFAKAFQDHTDHAGKVVPAFR